MANEYKLSYTGKEIDEKLGKIDKISVGNTEPTDEEVEIWINTSEEYDDSDSGGSQPDLVININLPAEKYAINSLSSEDCSYTGELQTVKAKIMNNENVYIVVKHVYHYANMVYTGTALPIQFGVNDDNGNSFIYIDCILASCPGWAGTLRTITSININDDGEILLEQEDII